MSDSALRALPDNHLLSMLANVSVTSGKAAMAYAALTDDAWFHAISELRRRYSREAIHALTVAEDTSRAVPRMRGASTVAIDPVRWKAYWHAKRMPLVEVSRLLGYCEDWASIIACKRAASFRTLDRLASLVGVGTADLVYAVGTDEERERERVGLLI